MKSIFLNIKQLVFLSLLIKGGFVLANNEIIVNENELGKCKSESEPLNRLYCYDELFAAPIRISTKGDDGENTAPSYVRFLQKLEKDRNEFEQEPLVIRDNDNIQRVSLNTTKKKDVLKLIDRLEKKSDVFMTFSNQSDDVHFKNSLLAVSCDNNITHFQLVLSQQFGQGEVDVDLKANNLNEKKMIFRASNDNYVLEAPRGIESIRLISQLRNSKSLQVILYASNQIYTTLFDISTLGSNLFSVSHACNWRT